MDINSSVLEFVRTVSNVVTLVRANVSKIRFVHNENYIRLGITKRGFFTSTATTDVKFQACASEITSLLAEYGSVFSGWEYAVENTDSKYSLVLTSKTNKGTTVETDRIMGIHGH